MASNMAASPARPTAASSIAGVPFDRIAVFTHARHLRERLEREIKRHQALAQSSLFEAEGFEREVEGVACHLPEVRMAALGGAQPSILQLFVAPQRTDTLDRIAKHVRARTRRRGEIEKRPVCIEDASADAGEWAIWHMCELLLRVPQGTKSRLTAM